MNYWFTSDTHFGHEKIIEYSKRPYMSIEDMDEDLIRLWNEYVRDGDVVWHLGDFNFRSRKPTPAYLHRLRGTKHYVEGNHDDKYAAKYKSAFASYQSVKYLKLYGEKIFLSHYAHRVWRSSHRGTWHLYGHSHGDLPSVGRSMDVGVDAIKGYRPISFEEIGAYMLTREPTSHHTRMLDE